MEVNHEALDFSMHSFCARTLFMKLKQSEKVQAEDQKQKYNLQIKVWPSHAPPQPLNTKAMEKPASMGPDTIPIPRRITHDR